MALHKENLTHHGVVSNYHRISMATLNHDHALDCVLQSYVSEDYAKDGNQLIEHFFTFKNISLEEEEKYGIRKLAYNKIKELPDWADATDC